MVAKVNAQIMITKDTLHYRTSFASCITLNSENGHCPYSFLQTEFPFSKLSRPAFSAFKYSDNVPVRSSKGDELLL